MSALAFTLTIARIPHRLLCGLVLTFLHHDAFMPIFLPSTTSTIYLIWVCLTIFCNCENKFCVPRSGSAARNSPDNLQSQTVERSGFRSGHAFHTYCILLNPFKVSYNVAVPAFIELVTALGLTFALTFWVLICYGLVLFLASVVWVFWLHFLCAVKERKALHLGCGTSTLGIEVARWVTPEPSAKRSRNDKRLNILIRVFLDVFGIYLGC